MSYFKNIIYQTLDLINIIGVSSYLKYYFTSKGKLVKISINRHLVTVRKGTPDLGVAVSCLDGEFDILKYLFPKDYDGIIIDAGGYIGTATIALKQLYPGARIFVIEPSSDNLRVLQENVSNLNNVEVIHGALVGTSEQSIQLKNRGTGEWGFTVIAEPTDSPSASFLQETPAFRISDLIKRDEKVWST